MVIDKDKEQINKDFRIQVYFKWKVTDFVISVTFFLLFSQPESSSNVLGSVNNSKESVIGNSAPFIFYIFPLGVRSYSSAFR